MAYTRFGSKQDEHNFFTGAFKIIDEQSKSRSQCSAVYRRLAFNASDGQIESWNKIPLSQISQTGFGGYKQALEEIFRQLANIYRSSDSQHTRCRVEQLIRDGVEVLEKRISEVKRGGLLADAEVTGKHLNVIELWSRCLKESMEESSAWLPYAYRRKLESGGKVLIFGILLYFLFFPSTMVLFCLQIGVLYFLYQKLLGN